LYTYYYTDHKDADSFKFFTDSKFIYDSLFTKPYDFIRMITGFDASAPELRAYYLKMDAWLNTNPIFNDNKTIIRLNAYFRFFSLGYYYVHVIFINVISFFGLFCLYKAFGTYAPNKKKELFYLTFLLPSLMFWGSGLLKDGILIGGFGLCLYSLVLLDRKGYSWKRLLGFLAGFGTLIITKVYVIAIIFPGLIAWWISRKLSAAKATLVFIIIYAAYLSTGFSLYRFMDTNLQAELFYKQKNFLEIAEQHSATQIEMPRIECSTISIIEQSPHAFANTMFRPAVFDANGNPLILMAAIENVCILFLILLCLISFSARGKKTDGFVLLCLVFILMLFTLIGLITPVLGAIVRYKIIALPCLVFLLVYYYDRDKIIRMFMPAVSQPT